MPNEEYSFVGGGSLKLKGVKGSKIDKKKRKSKKHISGGEGGDLNPELSKAVKASNDDPSDKASSDSRGDRQDSVKSKKRDEEHLQDSVERYGSKTAAELRHEERRRKMVRLEKLRLSHPTMSSPPDGSLVSRFAWRGERLGHICEMSPHY